MNCKNCKREIEGSFCSNCGQKSMVKRITFPNFIEEATESVFQINRGFLFTLRELTVRPGHSIRDFLNGKRKNHFKPIAFVLILSTVYFLATKLTGESTWISDVMMGMERGATDAGEDTEVPALINWLSDNYAYTTLLLLPLFSFASYLTFKGFKVNYLEHIVLNAYITGQQALFYIVFVLLHKTSASDYFEVLPLIAAMIYSIWAYNQFFEGENLLLKSIRTIAAYFIYLTLSVSITFLIIGLANDFSY